MRLHLPPSFDAPRRRSPLRGRRRIASMAALAVFASGLAVMVGPVVRWVSDYGVESETLHPRPVTETRRGLAADPWDTPASEVETAPVEGIAPSEPPAVPLEEVAAEPDRLETEEVPTRTFTTVGVRVPAAVDGPVLVRWDGRDGWSGWHELEMEADKGPDPGTEEAAKATGGVETEPLWIGEATAYQVNLPPGAAEGEAEVLLVRTTGGRLVADSEVSPAGAASLNQPAIRTRGEWGARPTGGIGEASELKMAIVHHSDTGNAYGPGDVPAILRSIQAYHIGGRGWSDIGYNMVVDKFGGIWEGRDGSIDRLSIGAHSQGFNTSTMGVMVLGNYQAAAPSGAAIGGVAEVIAWRFANERVDPASSVEFTSAGSLMIPAGVTRVFPRIIGHRNVGSTACPGTHLYSRLDDIRREVQARYPAKSSPGGAVDVRGGPNSLLAVGWALDPNTSDPIEVHAYLDGVGHNLGPADLSRPDIASLYRHAGPFHGFSKVFTGLSPGPHQLCVFAINAGVGSNTLISCTTTVVPTGSPIGSVDVARLGPGGELDVQGWALDPDTADPVRIHVYVDGVGRDIGAADDERSDIGGVFPLYGPRHGFRWSTRLTDAPHSVCVFAIDRAAPGTNTLLTCRDLVPPSGPPIGVVDAVAGGPDGTYGMFGWTLDPDVADPIEVHAYLDGVGRNLGRTSVDRADVAAAFPGYGARHGYVASGSGLAPGRHSMCVFGINVGPGTNTLLQCREFTVPGGSPSGVLDAASVGSDRRLRLAGWMIDPDTAGSIETHVYVDSVGFNLGPASRNRPDLAVAFPGYGPSHGFSWTSPTLEPGAHSVCVFAINRGVGDNRLLECRTVTA